MAARRTGVKRFPLPAEVVGNAFVDQYYHILQHSPDILHRFYQESSKLCRLDAHGAMVLVTTTEAINQKLLLSTGHVGAEMKTVDAQESLGDGVSVLVTGYLTGKDNVKRSFIQSFFLAPQDNGFFVLNDVFRFVEEAEHQQVNQGKEVVKSIPYPPKEPSFTCPICMNTIIEASSTICGHIFCKSCIVASIQAQKTCPSCRRKLSMNNFHRVYLPNTN